MEHLDTLTMWVSAHPVITCVVTFVVGFVVGRISPHLKKSKKD